MHERTKARSGLLADNAFFITIIGKGLGGLIELASGILLLFLSTDTLHHLLEPASRLGLHELASINESTKLFGVLYFGIRGFVRVILAICLLQERLWAYPVALVLLITAMGYQGWLMIDHYSLGLLLLTGFDLLIVALTFYEYRKLRHGQHLNTLHPLGRHTRQQ